ncbi:hypothetical protein JOF29_002990 [Kribbella aluminosa]|uniref:Rhamnogalacturonase A/B/Epimerase-like pectate lyase domain-containing protein n=1 Tax=Kribbella aluminosa TaxID=416017 RepID=A0ABS4UJS0_9ACTN|nr:glycosyl hydrolase family 28-related protein [Kribbella aluminosa]MBP2351907.1 hypothetical protein [Kribbella aluminosa]
MTNTSTDSKPQTVSAVSRRSFLTTAGLVAAGAAAASVWPATTADAAPVRLDTVPADQPPVLYSRQVRSGRSGEAFLIAGAGFSSAASARAWPVPNGTVTIPATPPVAAVTTTVPSVTDDSIALVIPSASPTDVYAIYVSSADGSSYSAPFLLNAAQAWFLDVQQASPGDQVTVYGDNLTLDNAAPTVELVAGSTASSVSIVDTDPYHVTFKIPVSTATGTYAVSVSNGHGGTPGHDQSLSLAVVTPAAPPATTIDVVADHGADPTGVADSTSAVQAALNAAAASSTGAQVTVPAGTYTISGKLNLGACLGPVVVRGAGRTVTTIRMSDSSVFSPSMPRSAATDTYGVSAADDKGMLYLAPSDLPVTVAGVTFDTNQRRLIGVEIDGRHNVTLSDVGVENVDYPQDVWLYVGCYGLIAQNSRNLTVSNCDFHCANGAFLIAVTDVRIQDSTFRLFFPRPAGASNSPQRQADDSGIKVWGAKRLTVRRNNFQRGSTTYYYARAVQTGALKVPASVFGTPDAGGVEDVYCGQNTVVGAGEPATNCGESIVGDQFNAVQGGRRALTTSAATATTIETTDVTFALASNLDPRGATVVITAGTGSGQLRKVVRNTTSALTVDTAWDVVPDTTSVFVVTVLHQRQLYVGNTITASPKYLGNYGPSALCIAAGNNFDITGAVVANPPGTDGAGIAFFGMNTGYAQPLLDLCLYTQINDNQVAGGHISYLSILWADNGTPTGALPAAQLLYGNVAARNTISNASFGVRVGGSPASSPYPLGTFGSRTLAVNNTITSTTTVNTQILARQDHSVYQGPAGGLTDAGTNTVTV